MFRDTFNQLLREQAELFLKTIDFDKAQDATTYLAAQHMPPSVVQQLLQFLNNRNEIENEELKYFQAGDRGLSLDSFFETYFSDEAKQARYARKKIGWDPVDNVENGGLIKVRPTHGLPVSPVELIVPDGEASKAALAGEIKSGGAILENKFETVKKLSQNWRKAWQSRYLFVEPTIGFGYYAKPVSEQERQKKQPKLLIPFGDILKVGISTPENTIPKKTKLKPESFFVQIASGRTYTFASDSGTSAATWCALISSHVLVHAVKNGLSVDRVKSFIESGGNVDATIGSGNQYPLLATAIIAGHMEIAEYLLVCGAQANCLLRWSFIVQDKVMSASDVLHLLMHMKYDLNLCGDDQHQWNLLHFLCLEGHYGDIKTLLERVDDPTVQAVNNIGDSALSLLLKSVPDTMSIESATTIGLYLCERSDLMHVDNLGDSVLHMAVKKQCSELTLRLILLGANVNARDSKGDTALHIAIKTNQIDLAAAIIDGSTNLEIDLCDKASRDSAFVLAIKTGEEKLACKLVEAGAATSMRSGKWEDKSCRDDESLHVAIKFGMQELAMVCIDHGASVTCPDTQGRTALHLAILHNLLQVAHFIAIQFPQPIKGVDYDEDELLREPSPINICDARYGESPLMMCFAVREIELACDILDAGAQMNLSNVKKETPLHRAVDMISKEFTESGYRHVLALSILKVMLETGDMDAYLACEPNHQTPFHKMAVHPVEASILGAAKVLIAHNPELPNARDAFGDSVLIKAVKSKNLEIAQLLIAGGCNIDIVNGDGDTALHLAAKQSMLELIQSALEQGAYTGIWDVDGNCPIHIAAAEGKDDVVEVFAKYCLQEGHLNYRTENGFTPAMVAVATAKPAILRSLMQYNVDLRLQIPGSRKGILHLAVDTCLDNNIEDNVKLDLIDALFGMDITDLSVSIFKANESSGKFSASKCFETLQQIQDRLETSQGDKPVAAPIVAVNDVEIDNTMETEAEKTADEELEAQPEFDVIVDEDELTEEEEEGENLSQHPMYNNDENNNEFEEKRDDSKNSSARFIPKFAVPIPFSQHRSAQDVKSSNIKQPILRENNSLPSMRNASPRKAKIIPTSGSFKEQIGYSQNNNQLNTTGNEYIQVSDEDNTSTEDDDFENRNLEEETSKLSDEEDSLRKVLFLNKISSEEHDRILEQTRDEARETAMQYINSPQGQRTVKRRVKKLIDKYAREHSKMLTNEEAHRMAQDMFVEEHIRESVADMKNTIDDALRAGQAAVVSH